MASRVSNRKNVGARVIAQWSLVEEGCVAREREPWCFQVGWQILREIKRKREDSGGLRDPEDPRSERKDRWNTHRAVGDGSRGSLCIFQIGELLLVGQFNLLRISSRASGSLYQSPALIEASMALRAK